MIQWITIDQIFPIEYCRISWTDFFHSHGQARKLCGCPSRQDPISRQLYGDGWTGKDTWKFVSVCGTYNFSKHMYENAQHLVGEGWRECTILQVSGGLCRRQEKIDGRCIQSWRSMWIWHFLGRRDPRYMVYSAQTVVSQQWHMTCASIIKYDAHFAHTWISIYLQQSFCFLVKLHNVKLLECHLQSFHVTKMQDLVRL